MACVSGNFEGKSKFDVALHFTGYLPQLLSDFQNLKSGILRSTYVSTYVQSARAKKNHVCTYVLSSEEIKVIDFYNITVSYLKMHLCSNENNMSS